MNIKTILTQTAASIPHTEARQLLAHLLNVSSSYLIAHDDEILTADQLTTLNAWVKRRISGEPLPYITSIAPFRHLELMVSPAVLIPRPDTELLVDHALKWIRTAVSTAVGTRRAVSLQVVDVGTGSGCIPIALATELETSPNPSQRERDQKPPPFRGGLRGGVHIHAVDISAEALAIAKKNAKKYNASITFHRASLLSTLDTPLDCITANLPYITDDEWTDLDSAVKLHEPTIALRGGVDGLDFIDDLLRQATDKLAPNGAIFLEIGWQQGQTAVENAQHHFPHAEIACHQDYGGRDRIITIFT